MSSSRPGTLRLRALALLLTPALASGCGGLAHESPAVALKTQPVQAAAENNPKAAPDQELRFRQAARLRGHALAAIDGGDWRTAISTLEELQDVLPDNLLPPLNLAVCHQQLGNAAAARAAIDRARELAPTSAQVLYALASIQRDADESGLDPSAWSEVLATYAESHPLDARSHYLEASWLLEDGNAEAAFDAAERAVDVEPENLVLLVERLVAAAAAERLGETSDALDAVEDRLDGFETPAGDFAEQLRTRIDNGEGAALSAPAQVLRNILRPTDLYRQHLIPLTGSGSAGRGVFVQLDFEPPLPKSIQGGQDIALEFIDRPLGLPGSRARGELILASLPERDTALFGTEDGIARLHRTESGWEREIVARLEAGERLWGHLDMDQDGLRDLLIERDRTLWLRPGPDSASELEPESDSWPGEARLLLTSAGEIQGVHPVDVDHDGDLDLVVGTVSATHYFQNNGDGSWLATDSLLGDLTGYATSALTSVDFDDDGDLDLVVLAAGRLWLLSNPRLGALEDVTAAWLPAPLESSEARLEVEDFDADGLFDILVWNETEARLLTNQGSRFAPAPLPESDGWSSLVAADFDNDGDRDLLAARTDGSTALLRNHRSGFVVEPAAPRAAGIRQMLAGDYDADGDLDVLHRSAGDLGYWRNDGGSLNHWLRVRLRGKSDNNSKNNSQGLFVRIESRAGQTFEAVMGNGGVNHLGLGSHRQVDALRVVWTNGLSQTWAALAADQTLDEEQVLKGSCPFLYTWNGERFEFVTDLMWKSPLGMIFADGTPAPHQAAKDFVLIPGELLRPAGGELWLQVTEELWETIYLDRQKLYAVDHPADTDLIVDERFTMPPHPIEPPLHWIADRRTPVAARDQRGRDVLAEIVERDANHVDQLPLTRYQGVTAGHALELDFTDVPAQERLRLVLSGWTFPTDTSINFALAQDRLPPPMSPRLDLATASGWRTLRPSIGFPNGKRKFVVVELTDLLPAGDFTLRLATEMQVYWDSAYLAVGDPQPETRITVLEPSAGDLHYRGFSRLYRETETGPHLFDYADVSTAPRFRDLGGNYTRFGPVRELLLATDNRYVVMNAGDELTVRFAARDLPPLSAGWRRDYVLFTDGWVKDGDIHTARSQTVEPLPFHEMDAYPNRRGRLPDPAAHRRWLNEYQTRSVNDAPFRTRHRTAAPPTLP